MTALSPFETFVAASHALSLPDGSQRLDGRRIRDTAFRLAAVRLRSLFVGRVAHASRRSERQQRPILVAEFLAELQLLEKGFRPDRFFQPLAGFPIDSAF